MLGQVERKGFGITRSNLFNRCFPDQRLDSVFGSAATHCVTQKPTPLVNQRASARLIVNFSFTNQRADSFSGSGVNLEAKI
jgi:hypothetical protein